VKVLFVAEGNHELGMPGPERPPRPADGVLYRLARKVSPAITQGLALRWREIALFPPDRRGFGPNLRSTGYDAKVRRAIVLSRLWGCDGPVCVADDDTAPEECLRVLSRGREQGIAFVGTGHRVALGVAVMSFDAWTLGAREAIAQVLGLTVAQVQGVYPPGRHIEDLFSTSGNPDYQPKRVLQKVARLANRDDCTPFREEVAEVTDSAALERACPRGFAPLAAQLRAAFGTDAPDP
jgi:hypothetical protein